MHFHAAGGEPISKYYRKRKKNDPALPVIGWREWIRLVDFDVRSIKAKVDTGARSSALHVTDLVQFEKEGQQWVRFNIHPMQRTSKHEAVGKAKVLEFRSVRSSSGKSEERPVIVANIRQPGKSSPLWPIELTLTNRDQMGFRMLLGREAVRNRFVVDPGQSFYGGKPKYRKKRT